jgi:hypothetical protein
MICVAKNKASLNRLQINKSGGKDMINNCSQFLIRNYLNKNNFGVNIDRMHTIYNFTAGNA